MVFTRIFVAIDGTDSSSRCLQAAIELAGRCGADLMVVAAVTVPDWVARHNMEYGKVEVYAEAAAQKCFRPAAELLKQAGLGAEFRVVGGHPAESLVTAIADSGADLVVMARRDRDEPKDLVLGSVSDRIARHVKVPILLVP
jgi:nucleotide-binding universal stress UspA family protein